MWERLSYYGARTFLRDLHDDRRSRSAAAACRTRATGIVMALYLSSVYLLSLPGGWIADRFLGQRKSVTIGGIGITLGNAMLALPIDALFYPGLVMIALGTGFLKPNISTIVGQLYKPDDIRRDAGFTIYYMGINIGAGAAPLVGMLIAQSQGFRGVPREPRHRSEPVLEDRVRGAGGRHGRSASIQYLARLQEARRRRPAPDDPRRSEEGGARPHDRSRRSSSALVVIVGGRLADRQVRRRRSARTCCRTCSASAS